ncbi:MAG TPA: hypothetical protein VN541_20690, partial [Tepidisphaeraceae bacterium]|nr:hypothetical protein [Tepidisphaeraceae bacterium]
MPRRLHRLFARPRLAAAVASAAAAALPLAALAANTDNYVGASGSNWNNSNDWIVFGAGGHTIPAAGDTANISLGPGSLFSI